VGNSDGIAEAMGENRRQQWCVDVMANFNDALAAAYVFPFRVVPFHVDAGLLKNAFEEEPPPEPDHTVGPEGG
jgi:hypothetical protein